MSSSPSSTSAGPRDDGGPTPTPTSAGRGAPSPPRQHGKVAVDRVTPEDPSVIAYLWGGDGTAVLTRADGAAVGLDDPAEVLDLGIRTLEAGVSTRIGDGLKRKLVTLAGNWSLDSIGVGPAVAV